jgi:glucose-1-phosphate adenylyltransferase
MYESGNITRNTIAMVLAGGKGERLSPITIGRPKPAVPFGGKYKIIDFVLSNMFNSGIRQVYILTQYHAYSLSKHIKDSWGKVSFMIRSRLKRPAWASSGTRAQPTPSTRTCS